MSVIREKCAKIINEVELIETGGLGMEMEMEDEIEADMEEEE